MIPAAPFQRICTVMQKHGVKPPDTFQSPEAFWDEVAGFLEELDVRLDPPPDPPRRLHG